MATPRLYVGNLLYQVQKNEVEDLLNKYEIAFLKIDFSTDPFTGRNPSYCFVDFDNAEHAARAKETIQGESIGGRPIIVNYNTRNPTNNTNLGPISRDKLRRARDDAPSAYREPFVLNRWSRDDASSSWNTPEVEKRRLMVDNIHRISPQHALQVEMRSLFDGFRIEAVSKLIVRSDENGASLVDQHFCFVDLASEDEAKRAARELDGVCLTNGRLVKIRRAVPYSSGRAPTKVEREQLGLTKPAYERDLSASWRRG